MGEGVQSVATSASAPSPRRTQLLGCLACAAIAAGFLAPSVKAGGFGPGDLLLSMTPWASYRDQFPDVRAPHNPQLDVLQQYFPWRMYASEQLRRGIIPLHNPHAYCGQPFLANVLSAVLYPPNLLALWMPVGRFFLVSAWLHLTLLGCGMWLLLRAHGLRPAAAMTGAVVAMLNGFVVGWLAYAPISQWTFAWFPWLPYLWLRAYRSGQSGRLVPCAGVMAMMLCGGHLQVAFYGVMAWLIYATGTLVAERDVSRVVGWVLGPLAVGGLLASPQILPAYELAFLSGRTSQDLSGALGTRVPPLMLGSLLMPYFWGHNALALMGPGSAGTPYSYWGPYINAIEASIGVGAVAVGLALIAVVTRRDRPTALFAAMVVVGVLLAMGTPLYTLCYKLIPGFSSLRALARAFAMVDLGLAGLAALGAQSCLDGLDGAAKKRAIGTVLVIGLGAILATWLGEMLRSDPARTSLYTRGLSEYAVPYALRQAIIACAGIATVAAAAGWGKLARALPFLVLMELGGLGYPLHRGSPPELYFFQTPETRWLSDAAGERRVIGCDTPDGPPAFLDWMPMNTPMAYGISSPCGSESLTYQAYSQVLRQFWDDQTFTPMFGHRLLNFVGARYLIARQRPPGSDAWRRIGGDRCGIWENRDALEPVFATAAWWPDDGSAPEDRPAWEPIITGAAHPKTGVTSTGPVSCLVRRFSPQREVATVDSPQRLMVVRSTVNGPGWRAWVAGAPTDILAAESVFQAVAASPGPTDVRFVYAPSSFRCGLFAALLAAMLAAGWAVAAGWEGARERTAAGPPHP